MSAIDTMRSRFSRVIKAGDGFRASCPLCQSRQGRPIVGRSTSDGLVLLKAFCGCDTGEVLAAVGLNFSDLFPARIGEFQSKPRPFDPLQVLEAVTHEVTVALLIAGDMAASGRGDSEQEQRLHVACARLTNALSYVGQAVPDEIKRIRRAEVAA